MPDKIKETDIYDYLKPHFESLGYEVYSEVLCNDVPMGVAYADMVLRNNNITTVIELKKQMSFDLLYQANRWLGVANYVYCAIIEPKGYYINPYARKCLENDGIGLITVEYNKEWGEFDKIHEQAKPKLYRKICTDWNKWITEEHKNTKSGGSEAGNWITPYSSTINQVKHCLKYGGAMTVDDILNICTTHYMNPKQGIYNALTKIETDWCETFKQNGKTYFKLKEA